MRITDIDVMLFSYPLPPDQQLDINSWLRTKTDAVIVRVETDEGIYGLAEPVPYGVPGPTEGQEYLKAVIDNELKPRLLGKNPFDADLLTRPTGGPVIRTAHDRGLAGINEALWDIMGKATGMPVYRLLEEEGDISPRVPLYASEGIHWLWKGRPDDLIDEAVRHKEAGFPAFKFRLGENWDEAGVTAAMCSSLIERVRLAVGPDFALMVDANCRMRSLEEALEVGRAIDRIGGLWYEEPMKPEPRAYAALAAALDVPIAGGEGYATAEEVQPFLESGGFEVVQTDPGIAGLSTAKRIAGLARRAGAYFVPHCWANAVALMAAAHLTAAMPNRMYLEYPTAHNPLLTDLLTEPLPVKDGYLVLSEKPGLGVELAPDAAERFPFIAGTHRRRL